jgi:hypothetical protein
MAVATGAALGILAVTAIAATTTTVSTTTTASAFTAGRTIFAGLGFVHTDRTTMKILVVQTFDRCLGLLSIGHLDEAEASRLAREFVYNDAGRRYRAIRFKGLTKVRIGRPVRKIPNEYIHSLFLLY